jgi:glycerol kinase
MTYVVAIDQGTTSSRALVFDREGRVCGVAQEEFEQLFPQPGWVEHDPNAIWKTQASVIQRALHAVGATPTEVTGIGITNQRETTVLWDRRTGEPIHNAIVWQDRRTAPACEQLRAQGAEDLIRAKTGLVVDPYFSGTKIAWILDHVDGARARAEAGDLAFGTIDTWLAWKLSGGALHVTDPSNASRTMLLDIRTGDWDDELLELLRVPRALLPEVRSSCEVYGEAVSTVPGAPIAGIAGDQQAALFGQRCFERGTAKNTYGTGSFLLLNTGSEPVDSAHRLVSTVAWARGGATTYALEGSVFIGGAVVQWLRDGLGIIESSHDVERLANTVEDAAGVYLVPAFAGLGAPHWDPYARGLLYGITRGTSKGHIARAALEGIAFSVADLLEAMTGDTGVPLEELRVDGGAAANDTLLQFQADILQIPIVRPAVLETTALGAAYLAGLSTGFWKSSADLPRHAEAERRFEPRMSADRADGLRDGWKDAVARSRGR